MLLKFFIPILFASNILATKFLVTGSSTIAPIMEEVARAYEVSHKGDLVDVQTGGSTRGVVDTRSGISDVGMVSRALKSDESDIVGLQIGMDGIGIITHASNKLNNLSTKQVLDIFTGKITNWKELGADDAKIVVVNKAEGRSTLELFCHYLKIKPSEIKAHIVIGDNEQGVKTVLAQKYAIGYVSIGTAEVNIKEGHALKLIKLDGIVAATQTVKDKTYPLARELNLVTRKNASNSVLELVEFAKNQKKIISELGFVPLEN